MLKGTPIVLRIFVAHQSGIAIDARGQIWLEENILPEYTVRKWKVKWTDLSAVLLVIQSFSLLK